jgi:hypothetical protein
MWSAAPILAASKATLTSGQLDELWVAAVASGVLAYAFAVYSRRVTGAYPWRWPPFIWGILGVLIPGFSLLLEALARLTTRSVPPAAQPFGSRNYFGADAPIGGPESADPSGPSSGWPPPPEPGTHWEPPAGSVSYPPPSEPTAPGQAWQAPAHWQPPAAPSQWQPPQPGQSAQAQEPGAPGPPTPAAPPWPPPLGPEAFQPAQGQPQAWQPSATHAYPPATQSSIPGPEGWVPPLPYVPAQTPAPLFGWYPDPTGRHEQRYWDGKHWSDRVSDNSVRSDDPLHPQPDAGTDPSAPS